MRAKEVKPGSLKLFQVASLILIFGLEVACGSENTPQPGTTMNQEGKTEQVSNPNHPSSSEPVDGATSSKNYANYAIEGEFLVRVSDTILEKFREQKPSEPNVPTEPPKPIISAEDAMKVWHEHWHELKKQKAQKPNEQPYIPKNFQLNLNRLGEREKALRKVAELIQGTNLINSKPQLLETMKLLGVLVLKTSKSEKVDSLKDGILKAIKKAVSEIKIEEDKDLIVEKNYKIELLSENAKPPNDSLWLDGKLWGLDKINMAEAWKEAKIDWTRVEGNIILAVIDSGIKADHPDLVQNLWENSEVNDSENGWKDDIHGANIRARFNKDGCKFPAKQIEGDPFDEEGHGTHVAGVAASVGNNDDNPTIDDKRRTVGVVGNGLVKIMSLKITCRDPEDSEHGTYGHLVEAIEYATKMKAHVVNLSLILPHHDTKTNILKRAIEQAGETGDILFVAAAGNDGKNIDGDKRYPASFGSELENLMTVAATNELDGFTAVSNKGATSVHLAAPGTNILSTAFSQTTKEAIIEQRGGTSVAAPFVSGCAAFIQAVRQSQIPPLPLLTPPELRGILMEGGDKSTKLDTNEMIVPRRLNCAGALEKALPSS